MNSPVITIIVPIYNTSKYLRDCLDSIRCQTFKSWVCFLINDGSTDNSQDIIDEYCTKDDRFVSFIKQNERSAYLTRKFGIERAETDLIMQIDSDDAVEPDFVLKMYNRIVKTGADIVCASVINCKDGIKGEVWRTPVRGFDMQRVMTGPEACLLTIGGWGISANNGVFKKKILGKFINYGEYMNSDELSQRQLLFYSSKVAVSDAEYYYRSNEGTSLKISIRMFDRTFVDMQLERFVYDNFPENKNKILAVAWQRLFNLIYLTSDFNIHKSEFTKEEQNKALGILRKSFKSLNRKTAFNAAPMQTLITLFPFGIYSKLATWYVTYKRNHGGKYFYR